MLMGREPVGAVFRRQNNVGIDSLTENHLVIVLIGHTSILLIIKNKDWLTFQE